ncbi:unnamed protein product, partial [Urochloa humidicola]
DYCLTCKGSGVVDGMKHVEVKLPAGAFSMQELILVIQFMYRKLEIVVDLAPNMEVYTISFSALQ